jgi:hypothetical protein
VCVSGASVVDDKVTVRVSISSIDVQAYAVCVGACVFYYTAVATPRVIDHTLASTPTLPFTFYGQLKGKLAVWCIA